jgi:hypothetical protein
MKRTASCLLAGLLLMAAVGTSQAASQHRARHAMKTHAVAATTASASCPIPGCTGPCPLDGKAAATTAAAKATHAMNRGACPVSDPSVCPSSCPRQSTGAVSTRVTSQ